MVAGISTPDSGRIAVAGETLFDSGAGIDIPAARRRAGYVFPGGRLFPQLRVRAHLLHGRHGHAPLPVHAGVGPASGRARVGPCRLLPEGGGSFKKKTTPNTTQN